MIRTAAGGQATETPPNETWRSRWRGLLLRVELRRVDAGGGTTLRVGPDATREWLRFDCFDEAPHWHLAPEGRVERHPLD